MLLARLSPSHRRPLPRDAAETIVLKVRGASRERIRVRIGERDLGPVKRAALAAGLPLPPGR